MAWNIGYKKKRKKDYIIIKTEFSPIFPQKKSDSSAPSFIIDEGLLQFSWWCLTSGNTRPH